jgi:type II secretory pathway component PulC
MYNTFIKGLCSSWWSILAVTIIILWLLCSSAFMPVPTANINQDYAQEFNWSIISDTNLRDTPLVFKVIIPKERGMPKGRLAARFRLAGTFFATQGYQKKRCAIIDDLKTGVQQLVQQGESIDSDILVREINLESVVLQQANHTETLYLIFSGNGVKRVSEGDKTQTESAGAELSKFGEQVGGNKWLLKRKSVLDYYQELLDHPDRLAKVFDSLKPVYKNNNITGYVLDIEGEKDMFNSFGLRENDIVRKVNSMPMTNRSRAEYFIAEFVRNRANAFVLEIERGNKRKKLVYLMR